MRASGSDSPASGDAPSSGAADPLDGGRPRPVFSEPEPRLPKPRGAGVLAWGLAATPLLIALALFGLSRVDARLTETIYARRIYPFIAGVPGFCAEVWESWSGQPGLGVPRASLSELLIVVLVGLSGWRLFRSLRRGGLGAGLRSLLLQTGIALLALLGLWGLNHGREPVATMLGLRVEPVTALDLAEAVEELASELAARLGTDDVGLDRRAVGTLVSDAWAKQIAETPALGWDDDPVIVGPLLSSALVAGGISGIFSPLTGEAHVAQHLPDVDLAFTALHEVAHVQGWAREDEANYLAWLVGSRSGSLELERAAYAVALSHAMRALARADSERWRAAAEALDPAVVALIEERAAFWRVRQSVAASRVTRKINDTYLRSQGHAGVASYGRMVDLLIAEFRQR